MEIEVVNLIDETYKKPFKPDLTIPVCMALSGITFAATSAVTVSRFCFDQVFNVAATVVIGLVLIPLLLYLAYKEAYGTATRKRYVHSLLKQEEETLKEEMIASAKDMASDNLLQVDKIIGKAKRLILIEKAVQELK